jgi:hypothetical protein
MINDEHKQEEQASEADVEGEEYRQAMQHFTRSLFRAGMGLAFIPVSMLPQEPRQHFKIASREFSHGLAKLAQKFAEGLDEKADAH